MDTTNIHVNKALEADEQKALLKELLKILQQTGVSARRLNVIPGRSHLRTGTHRNESISCEMEDGSRRQFFLKYSKDYCPSTDRHRAGIPHESEIYRQLLRPFAGSSPKLIAAGEINSLGVSFLLLEELEGFLRVSKTPSENMTRAAEWIGRFHAENEVTVNSPGPKFLSIYNKSYYRQWSRNTCRLTQPLHIEFPWLPKVCNVFEQNLIPFLLDSPQTAIHAEFYPKNILAHGPVICPVDWESAALAAGEIDLASLIEGWAEPVRETLIDAYCQARWPGGAPQNFRSRLTAAQIYFHLRWLGDRPDFATGKKGRKRLSRLGDLLQETGLLPESD